MNEIKKINTIQGAFTVKKTMLVAALAAVMVFAFASTALAYGPIWSGTVANGQYNAAYPGYLSWGYVEANATLDATVSPHGNYTTTTMKCAVCHAVHRASKTGKALTPWGGTSGDGWTAAGTTLAPFESCYFCHGTGATFTDKTVEFAVATSNTLTPHTTCGRCHTASPHGAGASDFPLLSSKLINDHGDAQIYTDLGISGHSANNGLTADMFDLTNASKVAQGTTLATGYLCVGCHGSTSNEHVFSVNERNATPAIHYTSNATGGAHAAAGKVTGHQVWVDGSDTYYNADLWYSGGGTHDYYLAVYVYDGKYYKVESASTFTQLDDYEGATIATGVAAATIQAAGWDSQIAWADAYGCQTCHDAQRANGKSAFPHGYVTSVGTPAPKRTSLPAGWAVPSPGQEIDASYLWMTIGSSAASDTVLMKDNGTAATSANKDGACLKCHVESFGGDGVGITY